MKNFGIDVSEWQGTIDWKKAKAAGIKFALLRCGYGSDKTANDDETFRSNAEECERLGIPYGVYLYSYAGNTDGAASEAAHAMRLLKGLKPEYPVYLDLEDSSVAALGSAQILENTKKFVETLEAAGYWVGVYANVYWWNTNLTNAWYDTKARWVAQYNSECEYSGEYGIWQYTSGGSVAGIAGNVDCNYCYLDYPTMVKEAGKNGFPTPADEDGGKQEETPKPAVPEAKPETVYTVKSGDTLSGIAAKYGTTYQALAAHNGIENPNIIYVGQKIKIPGAGTASKPTKSTDAVAREVIRGDWGNGAERKRRLTAAGYDAEEIQARVNTLMS